MRLTLTKDDGTEASLDIPAGTASETAEALLDGWFELVKKAVSTEEEE